MLLRRLVLLSLVSLLAACSSEATKPPAATPAVAVKPVAKAPQGPGPLPAHQRELSGTLQGCPPAPKWKWHYW